MKKLILFFSFICIMVLFASCGDVPAPGTTANIITTTATEATTQATTAPIEETTLPPVETTEPAPRIVELTETYTVKVLRADFPIYSEPGYTASPVTTVKKAGVYTIVAEFSHPDGTLWGRLKSGLGWVDLTQIEKEANADTVVTALYADAGLLYGGNYYYYNAEPTIYGVTLAIRTNTLLRNVSFFQFIYDFDKEAYGSGPELYHIDLLDSSKPFVVRLSFPGYTSAWGFKFTDAKGVTQTYILQDGGGLEENANMVNFYRYTKSYHPYEEPDLTPSEPTTDVPWKKAYLEYIDKLGSEKDYSTYSLVYADGDDIPELFISGSCEASGSQICSYQNGQLMDQHLQRLNGASYIPRTGLVYNFNGNMGYYNAYVYRLGSSGFTTLFSGLQEDSVESITKEDGQVEDIYTTTYYIYSGGDATEVSEEEFYAAQENVFDFDQADSLSADIPYSDVKTYICNW